MRACHRRMFSSKIYFHISIATERGPARGEVRQKIITLFSSSHAPGPPDHVTLEIRHLFLFFVAPRQAIAFCGSSVQAELWWRQQEDAKPSLLSSCVHFQSIIQSSMYFAEIERSANRCHFSTEFSIYVLRRIIHCALPNRVGKKWKRIV